MSSLTAVAHFVVLINGVSVQVESVNSTGPHCPRPLEGSIKVVELVSSQSACEGMVWEAGTIRYWTLSPRDSKNATQGWRGWQTRVLAKDFPRLMTGQVSRITFPESDLSLRLR